VPAGIGVKKAEMKGSKPWQEKLARKSAGKIVEIVPHYRLANQGV